MNNKYHLFIKVITLIFLITVTVFQNMPAQTLPPNFLWAVSGGGNGYDEAADVTVDNQDNVIVTGDFDSTATFGGFVLTPTGSRDIFLVKYTSGGNASIDRHVVEARDPLAVKFGQQVADASGALVPMRDAGPGDDQSAAFSERQPADVIAAGN